MLTFQTRTGIIPLNKSPKVYGMNNMTNSLRAGKTPARTVLKLSLPAIIEQLMITCVSYIDTAMVGSLGKTATAAIGVCSSFIWFVSGFVAAVALGFSVQTAQYFGAGRLDDARETVRRSFLSIPAAGLPLAAAVCAVSFFLPGWMGAEEAVIPLARDYLFIIGISQVFLLGVNICSATLRSVGDTKTPMVFNTLLNVINIIMNFFFIFQSRSTVLFGTEINVFGFGMGVAGAAIGSLIASACTFIMYIVCIFFGKRAINPRLSPPTGNGGAITGRAVRLGVPAFLERAAMSSGQILMTYLVTGLGSAAVSANSLAVTAESISYLPASGFSLAAAALIGQAVGAGEKELARRFAKISLVMGVCCLCVSGAVLYVFSDNLIGFFIDDAEVITLGGRMLRIVSFAEPFFAVSIVLSGVFRGVGNTKIGFFTGLICMWGGRIVPALFLVPRFGLDGAWYAMVIDLVLRAVVTMAFFLRPGWESGGVRVTAEEEPHG